MLPIIDEETLKADGYLYPESMFVAIDLSTQARQALVTA